MQPQLGLPALGRFPQFSAIADVCDTLTEVEAENSRNRPNMAFFLLPPSAVALLRLSVTVNKVHMVPSSLITSETQRRATAYQWFEELRNAYDSNNVV